MFECLARCGAYPPARRWIRPLWAAECLGERSLDVLKSWRFDVTMLQRELLSTYATLEWATKRPRVLDVDDPIWLRRRGRFARRIAAACDAVICGNAFIAEGFRKWNSNVVTLATGVDTERFLPARGRAKADSPVIVWSGTSGGYKYLYLIEDALAAVLERWPNARLRTISDCRPRFVRIATSAVEYISWSEDCEVGALQDAAVGIMPMDGSLWARGKCSYKMLTYMACGLPVVASPVGMNAELLGGGNVGYGARTVDEWVDALDCVLSDSERAAGMGLAGRRLVEREYSVGVLAPVLAATLRKVAAGA